MFTIEAARVFVRSFASKDKRLNQLIRIILHDGALGLYTSIAFQPATEGSYLNYLLSNDTQNDERAIALSDDDIRDLYLSLLYMIWQISLEIEQRSSFTITHADDTYTFTFFPENDTFLPDLIHLAETCSKKVAEQSIDTAI